MNRVAPEQLPTLTAIKWSCHAETSIMGEVDGKTTVVAECGGNGAHNIDNARRAAEIVRRCNIAPELARLLKDCADRFERCCIHSGSDKAFAAAAVMDYRAAVAKVLP